MAAECVGEAAPPLSLDRSVASAVAGAPFGGVSHCEPLGACGRARTEEPGVSESVCVSGVRVCCYRAGRRERPRSHWLTLSTADSSEWRQAAGISGKHPLTAVPTDSPGERNEALHIGRYRTSHIASRARPLHSNNLVVTAPPQGSIVPFGVGGT